MGSTAEVLEQVRSAAARWPTKPSCISFAEISRFLLAAGQVDGEHQGFSGVRENCLHKKVINYGRYGV